jgi:hypothetical protein
MTPKVSVALFKHNTLYEFYCAWRYICFLNVKSICHVGWARIGGQWSCAMKARLLRSRHLEDFHTLLALAPVVHRSLWNTSMLHVFDVFVYDVLYIECALSVNVLWKSPFKLHRISCCILIKCYVIFIWMPHSLFILAFTTIIRRNMVADI